MSVQFDDITVSDAITIVEDAKLFKMKQFDKFIERLRELQRNPTKYGAERLIQLCQNVMGESGWYLMQDVRDNIKEKEVPQPPHNVHINEWDTKLPERTDKY